MPTCGTEEIFDIEADPGERRNLVRQRPADATRLRVELDAIVRDAQRRRAGSHVEVAPQAGLEESLRALGYVQ